MIRFISVKGLEEKSRFGEKPLLIDISTELSFQKSHPKGAVNLPVSRLKEEGIARSYITNSARELILFADDFESEAAWEAAELLHQQGFNNLYIYQGGKGRWIEDGLPFEAVHYPPIPPESPPSRKDFSPKDTMGKDSAA